MTIINNSLHVDLQKSLGITRTDIHKLKTTGTAKVDFKGMLDFLERHGLLTQRKIALSTKSK